MVGLNDSDLNLDPDCELFKKGDPTYQSVAALSRTITPAGLIILGCAANLMHNFTYKKPLRSGIHRYGLAVVFGLVVGDYVNKWKDEYLAERDFQFYHYMTLHPEDFQPPERVKYKNYLGTWVPLR